jgi:hypothetical protein
VDHRLRLFGISANLKNIALGAMGKRMSVGDFPRIRHSMMVYRRLSDWKMAPFAT